MKNSLVNKSWLGRDELSIEAGKPANPQINHVFEPSLTDQTFNYSIGQKVEDFIAAGQVIQAAAMKNDIYAKSDVQDSFAENNPLTFYGKDLPEELSDIRAEAKRVSKILEEENLKTKEKKELEEYLAKLKEAGGV